MEERDSASINSQRIKNDQDVLEVVKKYLKSSAFTDRKLTDNPTDDLMVVNRKFVTQSSNFGARPTGAVTGQFFFATDLATNGLASWYNGTNWVSGTGSILGAGV